MAEHLEWEEADLLGLIDRKAEESLELDFKRCDALDISTGETRRRAKEKVSKHVSAFANAAGGTILYGMKEKNHVAAELDDGYDPNVVTREWIEQVINANVHPPVPGFRVKTIQLEKSRPGRVAYAVSIPQGTTAHQASDKRYYRRRGTECLAMDDYEIRDVMGRTVAPKLNLELTIDGDSEGNCEFTTRRDEVQSPLIEVAVTCESDGDICEYSQHQIFLPSYLSVRAETLTPLREQKTGDAVSFRPSATQLSADVGHINYGLLEFQLTASELPLFPGERRSLARFFMRKPEAEMRRTIDWILWRTRAGRMTPRNGAVIFNHQAGTHWTFSPSSIEDIEAGGYTIEFAP